MNKPFIIAEIAQGYEGSAKLVELYVKAASSAGADAIKFQIFYADELALKDYQYYSLFKALEIPFDVWGQAVKESHKRGMEFYSDVFGADSFRELEKIEVDGYKIHSTDVNNYNFLKVVAESRKKIFLSTGGCYFEEIEKALDIFGESPVTLMYGFQAEPTEIKDNHLLRIRTLKKRFNRKVGFQDHTAGDSELASHIPFLAMGAGADVIEKHLTLSRVAEIEDYVSGMTPEEFTLWTSQIKKGCLSLGQDEWNLTEKELEYRGKVRRAVCSAREISQGETIKEDAVTLKRSGHQNIIHEISTVSGKTATRQIKKNSVIEKGDVE